MHLFVYMYLRINCTWLHKNTLNIQIILKMKTSREILMDFLSEIYLIVQKILIKMYNRTFSCKYFIENCI